MSHFKFYSALFIVFLVACKENIDKNDLAKEKIVFNENGIFDEKISLGSDYYENDDLILFNTYDNCMDYIYLDEKFGVNLKFYNGKLVYIRSDSNFVITDKGVSNGDSLDDFVKSYKGYFVEKERSEGRANSNMRCDSLKSLMIINKLSKFL
ncbi:hypothetical protein [Acinetobacter haemolyticus]|uniref:hypothetical protein n=1 Tax=Acinetobacter haemolyticus TaxID=29430 RepID=UPI000C2B81DB|nr:hypothetical protein [Acinetobacter haemolyticus]ATZ68058.1 hypothetical protein BSR56_12310 [Acinetobacter haemolyticus]